MPNCTVKLQIRRCDYSRDIITLLTKEIGVSGHHWININEIADVIKHNDIILGQFGINCSDKILYIDAWYINIAKLKDLTYEQVETAPPEYRVIPAIIKQKPISNDISINDIHLIELQSEISKWLRLQIFSVNIIILPWIVPVYQRCHQYFKSTIRSVKYKSQWHRCFRS